MLRVLCLCKIWS